MLLFPETFIHDVRGLPGASYSFVKHLCSQDGEPLRRFLETAAGQVDEAISSRWLESLRSLDNRKFFQGYSEATTASMLIEAGWRISGVSFPGPCLQVTDPGGKAFNLVVLGFVRQVRPAADEAIIDRLARALSRVDANARVAVLIRKWLPHDFDPEPVRRAIDLWLNEVDKGSWEGRYATYDDDHVALEFALATNEGGRDHGVVLFGMGPFLGGKTAEVLETRLVYELDSYRMGGRKEPVILSCVSDQPWLLSPGYEREIFYGKPECTTSTGQGVEMTFGAAYAPCVFRDSMYAKVSGVIIASRPTENPTGIDAHSYLNPWAESQLAPKHLPCPTFAEHHRDGDSPILRWFNR